MESLEFQFISLAQEYTSDQALIAELWLEIETAYTHSERYYHSLSHLSNLQDQLASCKPLITDWNVLQFSLYYHDIIYDPSRSDNEEKSAELAVKRMQSLGVPTEKIEKCHAQILATKSHQPGNDLDTDLFTDADLSILGSSAEIYKQYAEQVRSEYAIYPDQLYNPGRIKVLQHFLEMERIFKTDFFYTKFEQQARENLVHEMEDLNRKATTKSI